jgi:SAM-dependent methyltransferase
MSLRSHSHGGEENVALFRKGWSIYDAISEKNYMFHREIYARVGELLRERNGGRNYSLLDLGCGNARFLAPCLERTPPGSYCGVDLSAAALEEAAGYLKGLPRVEFFNGDMVKALEETEGSFDVIFSGYALHHLHVAGKERFFRACARRLKREGVFLMVDLVREVGESRDKFIGDYVHYMRTQWTDVIPEQLEAACGHVSAYDFPETASELTRMAKAANFESTRLVDRFAQHYLFEFSAK